MSEVITLPDLGNGTRKMLARYNASVLATLERVVDLGIATVLKTELTRWYGQERLSRGVWRDIEDKWRDELQEEVPLLVAENEGTMLFVYGEGITCSKDAWFQPVSVFANRPAD